MNIICILIGMIFFIADFLSKRYVIANVDLGETFGHFTPLIDFTYVQNTGAAFSILEGKMILLSVISVVFSVGVVVFWVIKKPESKLLKLSLSLLLAGALGNAVDRIAYGFVVDFIQTTFINFPVFNIADIGVTVGAVLLAVYAIFFDETEKKENSDG